MRNKSIVIFLLIIFIIIALAVILFFKKNGGNTPENPSNIQNSQKELSSNEQSKMVTEDFSIDVPSGWQQVTPAMGVTVMAIKNNEALNNPAAEKINFNSYYAVVFDTLQEKTLKEYAQEAKNSLEQTITNISFSNEQNLTINNQPSYTIEGSFNQQGVDFKTLLVMIEQKGSVWNISFNTTASNWEQYQETFYNTAESFKLKTL